MIKTARQLKDKVKNLVGDTNLNNKLQTSSGLFNYWVYY